MTALLQDQPIVQQAYGQYRRFLHDQATDREETRTKGRVEGIVICVDKGKSERNIEIARSMKSEGCASDFIARMTGPPSSEIDHLILNPASRFWS